jgi:ABC-type transporter Mla subunit MlaD
MSNLTEVVDKLADGQVDIYGITSRLANRQVDTYELIGSLAQIVDQLEQAVGGNPSSQKFDAIRSKISELSNTAYTEEQALQAAINAAMIDKGKLAGMAETSFDQPPVP